MNEPSRAIPRFFYGTAWKEERTEQLTRLNAELERAKAQAEQANISKTRFLAAASHDILQPLNAARLYVTSLVERQTAHDDSQLVGNIDASLDAVEEIVPDSRLALSWEWAGESWGAPTRVEFQVEADPTGASLLILHSGFDRLVPERRLAARRNYAAAWPEVLSDLKRLVTPAAA